MVPTKKDLPLPDKDPAMEGHSKEVIREGSERRLPVCAYSYWEGKINFVWKSMWGSK